ncbi:MAG: four helix bundle protein [Planctomycetota bacterium]|nr:four helix bundle protein [Planctomycetota bacterium]
MIPYKENEGSFGFENLEVYKVAREFRKRAYKLVKLLPAAQRFALAQQMRRAAVSITNNIAEGHGRYHYQDNTRFCRQARGSLAEIVADTNVCIDEGYAEEEHLLDLKADAARLFKLINGYIAYLQKQRNESSR